MNNTSVSVDIKKIFLHDKSFVMKLVFLSSLIIVLSTYLVLKSLNVVSDLSVFENTDKLHNADIISLRSFDDTFGYLEELDLSKIELAQNTIAPKITKQPQVKPVVKVVHDKVVKVEKIKEKKIFIQPQKVASIKFLKSKFSKTNSPIYASLLSKKYFEEKKYKSALKWALITNEIDNKNEDSWVLFAKAKAKLNQKKDAINALNEYLKNNDSQRVELVLEQIKKVS